MMLVPSSRRVRAALAVVPFLVLSACVSDNTRENNFSDLARGAGKTPARRPTPTASPGGPEEFPVSQLPTPTPEPSPMPDTTPVPVPTTAPAKGEPGKAGAAGKKAKPR